MGLNETLDRLAKEREEREENGGDVKRRIVIQALAERVFFARMLKDINHGMSEPKIEQMIDRSVMIARKLYDKLEKI